MLKRYQEFITESLDLILESDVVYSDKFRKVVSSIDSPIAKKIIEIENTDLPVRANYFDIVPGKNDSITFLNDRKAQEILGDKKEMVKFIGGEGGWLTHNLAENGAIFDLLGYKPESDTPYKPQSGDIAVGEVIKKVVSPTSGKTWVWVKFPAGQGVYNNTKLQPADDKTQLLWQRGRQDISIGRGIRALLLTTGEKFLDKDIEQFVNLYKSAMDKLNDKFSFFEEVKGDTIAYWYNKRNYEQGSGQLHNSCMATVPADYFQIYTLNPDKVSMVIYKNPENPEKILGRAIIWTLNSGIRFMDRIYCIKDSDIELFRQYAKENGIYYKKYNGSSDSGQAIAPDGTETSLQLEVTLRKGYYDRYPYLDTLKYWDPSGRISNRKNSSSYTLEDTGGDYINCEHCGGSGTVECGDCGGSGNWDCSSCDGRGKTECSDCDGDGKVECSECDGSGKTTDDEGDEIDCSNCEGKGKVECSDCDGRGEVECGDCDGNGRQDCEYCNGNGEYDCPECR